MSHIDLCHCKPNRRQHYSHRQPAVLRHMHLTTSEVEDYRNMSGAGAWSLPAWYLRVWISTGQMTSNSAALSKCVISTKSPIFLLDYIYDGSSQAPCALSVTMLYWCRLKRRLRVSAHVTAKRNISKWVTEVCDSAQRLLSMNYSLHLVVIHLTSGLVWFVVLFHNTSHRIITIHTCLQQSYKLTWFHTTWLKFVW